MHHCAHGGPPAEGVAHRRVHGDPLAEGVVHHRTHGEPPTGGSRAPLRSRGTTCGEEPCDIARTGNHLWKGKRAVARTGIRLRRE